MTTRAVLTVNEEAGPSWWLCPPATFYAEARRRFPDLSPKPPMLGVTSGHFASHGATTPLRARRPKRLKLQKCECCGKPLPQQAKHYSRCPSCRKARRTAA